MNGLKTAVLLATLTALLLFIGAALGGQAGMVIAFIIAAVMNLGAYWFSDKIVLKMYRAQPIQANHPSGLYEIVKQLAQRANLPMPKVYLIENDMPNAFATGRSPQHASVAATTGLLHLLSREEMTGVMGHEMSHVLHRDTLIGAVSATIAGAISFLANMFMWSSIFGGGEDGEGNMIGAILIMILGPIAAGLIQMAISRSREYSADASGAKLCGHPEWLASALQKLEAGNRAQPMSAADHHPATAHLFIINPLHANAFAKLFSTHPPTEDRIKRLMAMRSGGL